MLTRLHSPAAATRWLRQWTRGTLRTDSRRLEPGDAFIAWPGHSTDGRRYVAAAFAAGASTCLVEAEGVEAFGFDDVRIGALPQLKAATGHVAAAWFGHPSERLCVVAVTGTNGKTSTAWWTAQALTLLGRRCGVVGTLGIGDPPLSAAGGDPQSNADQPARIEFTGLTTPDPVALQAALKRMADAGYAACAMEASSIGIAEHRLAATRVAVALFTNFSRDHLDYHGDMDAYWAAKRALFDAPGLEAAVLNVDDEHGAALAAELQRAGRLQVWTYSTQRRDARLSATELHYADGGLAFTLHEAGGETHAVQSSLIGDYNAANLLAVLGGLRALGVPLADAVAMVPRLTPVPGRMQRVTATPPPPRTAAAPEGAREPGSAPPGPQVQHDAMQPELVVDYAHTPDALDKALAALRPLAAARGGKLWAVFGCGGSRDASKRPLMGAIAEQLADRVVLTTDNPRQEAPAAILAQIAAGLANPQAAPVVEDRARAIAWAVQAAGPHDVLLIAGKGHEDYQEVAGVKRPFSDVDEAQRALAARLRT